jgi:hypothetical protein
MTPLASASKQRWRNSAIAGAYRFVPRVTERTPRVSTRAMRGLTRRGTGRVSLGRSLVRDQAQMLALWSQAQFLDLPDRSMTLPWLTQLSLTASRFW